MPEVPAIALSPNLVYREEPVRHHHGAGVAPGRYVIEGIWPYRSPEACESRSPNGIWLDNGQVLACPGCGLDCT